MTLFWKIYEASGIKGGSKAQKMAARLGVEPRQNESESFVLPLHHRAVKNLSVGNGSPRHKTAKGTGGLQAICRVGQKNGAGDGIRTRNRLFTKQVLYH